MDIEPMSDGMIRQRRNLLLICCILGFTKYAEIKIEKLTLLGMQFSDLGNPQSLYTGIWVLFLYFSIRFYQYFMQEGLKKIRLGHHHSLEESIGSSIRKYAAKNHPGCTVNFSQVEQLKNNDWQYSITTPYNSDGMEGNSAKIKSVLFSKVNLWRCHYTALWKLTVNSNIITDYLLPVALAIAVVYFCFSGGEVSLINTLTNIKN
ncbi:MAG: hypothetical protein ACJA0E_000152 [Bermanella sp.]|jgi:hypothetical protein